MKNLVYLLLGSNMDDRAALLDRSRKLIGKEIGDVKAASAIYDSEPWGFDAEKNFLNQVLLVETGLDSRQLLEIVLNIERRLGRVRVTGAGYTSRTIDIDILFFNDSIIHEKDLEVPHPRMHERMFTLIPMQEIAADYVHPAIQKTIRQLAAACVDNSEVTRFENEMKPDNQQ